jgi:hypothetical protein
MTAAQWNIIGLIVDLVGILLLFVFQMPFQVRTGGAVPYVAEKPDQSQIAKEKAYDIFSWIGLALVVLGVACQVKANL